MDDGTFPSTTVRAEVLEHASSNVGAPFRVTGAASWLVTGFFLLVIVAVALFVTLTPYSRKERVFGVLAPAEGAVDIVSQRGGLITKLLVAEGQPVKAGDPIAVLSLDTDLQEGRPLGEVLAETADSQGEAFGRRILAQRESATQRQRELELDRRSLEAQLDEIDLRRPLLQRQVEMALSTLEASRLILEKGYLTRSEVDRQEQNLIQGELQLQGLAQQTRQARDALAKLSVAERKLLAEIAEQEAGFDASLAALREKRASVDAQKAYVVSAEKDGRVAALAARPGSAVAPGARLATLLPNDLGLQAELWFPSRAVAFVRPGNPVRLMYEAFPYQRYGVSAGSVRTIAGAPTEPTDLPPSFQTKEALYLVRVGLAGQSIVAEGRTWPLRPGMRLSAEVLLDERPLVAWLFEPLMAARARAAGPGAAAR